LRRRQPTLTGLELFLRLITRYVAHIEQHRRRPLMHEENDDREQYRQCAKANHCNSKTNVRHKNNPSRNQAGGNVISLQSPVVAGVMR